MQNRRIVKGAPCHALWLLTPSPDYLAGRRVTCNPVVLADVLNAGAFYVPAPAGTPWYEHVVVDDDLVTNMSALHEQRAGRDGAAGRRDPRPHPGAGGGAGAAGAGARAVGAVAARQAPRADRAIGMGILGRGAGRSAR